MNFAHLLRCFLLSFIHLSVYLVDANLGKLQSAGAKGLERSVLVRRLLLVVTLDGTLYAFDKYTGALYWKTANLGNSTITGSYSKEHTPTNPVYIVEPQGPGSIYAYIPGSGVKGLVTQSPVRWPDGTLFIGQKTSVFYALDIRTGEIMYKFAFGPGLSPACPSDEVLDAFSGASRSLVLIAKSEFSLSAFPTSDTILGSPILNITYGDYGGFINPFDPVQQPLNDDEDNVSQVLHSSFNGIILVRDRFTDQVMWARKLSSIAISFFKLAESIDGDSTSQYLIKLPIASLGSEAQQADLIKRFKEIPIQEQAVTVGNSDGCLFVLPADQFPTLVEEVRHDRPLSKDALTVAVTDEKVSDSSHQITPDYDCRPGHPDFPNCLLGNRRAQVIQPVPLLGPASKNEKIFWWPLMMTIVIVLTSTVMVIYVTRRRPEGATVVTEPSLIGRLPPGFEEISIGRAESMYTIQTESSDISPPTSFVISDEIVGYGSHGTVVFKGEYDGRPVAIKRMLADFYDLAGHEVALLQQSDHHPNVIRYFFRERTEKFVYIVLELCVGSLADLIDGADIRRREELEGLLVDPKSLLEQVTRGLGHLHAMKLIHRDIKPHNILITPQKRLVISDFGLGKKLIDNQSSFHPTIQSGTVGWRAPESILNEEATELSKLGATSQPVGIKISKSVDIFALGCVFFYVLTRGEHPFGSRLQREMNIINNKYDISKLDSVPDAADLILRLIDRRPEKRPNCQQILAHPYFWPAQKQVAFLQDLSDRFEFEDRKPSSAIIDAFESRRKVIFEGNNAWNRLLDSKVWYDLCSYRRYNGHSARDLLRALRNKRSHFHELSKELRAIVGETPEAFMGYFLERFPRLLIEAYRLVETTELRNENTFASVYF